MRDQEQIRQKSVGRRWKTLLLALGLVFAFGAGGPWAAGSSVSDCLSNLDPSVRQAVLAAIASQPSIANNPEAQLVYLGILSGESGFTNLQSGGDGPWGKSDTCPGVSVSYGIGQVNYKSHIKEIIAAGWTGYTGDYCADLKSAGKWMLAHPAETLKISAGVFAANLNTKKCQGNAWCAAKGYCGGCDEKSKKPYLSYLQDKIKNLGSCGDGTALISYDPGDGGAPFVLKCPEIYLADALNKANKYFVAASLSNARAAREAATSRARANMSGYELTSSGLMKVSDDIKTPLGNIRMNMCLDYMSNFYETIRSLLSRVNLLISTINYMISQLVNAACNYVSTTINNALTSLCLPLPDIGNFGPNLSGPQPKGCNGLSLSDIMYVTQNRWTEGTTLRPLGPQEVVDPIVRIFKRPDQSTGTSQ